MQRQVRTSVHDAEAKFRCGGRCVDTGFGGFLAAEFSCTQSIIISATGQRAQVTHACVSACKQQYRYAAQDMPDTTLYVQTQLSLKKLDSLEGSL